MEVVKKMIIQKTVQNNNLNQLCISAKRVNFEHSYMFCLRCGKPLLSEESRLRGYGKICERKAIIESKLNLF